MEISGSALIMALAMSLGLNNLIIIGNLSAVDASYKTTMNAMYSAPLAIQILCLAVLVPICEEYVFRGLFFRRMEKGKFVCICDGLFISCIWCITCESGTDAFMDFYWD